VELVLTILASLASGALAGYLTFLLEVKKVQKEYQLQDRAERWSKISLRTNGGGSAPLG
jgi:hypothetical protein